MNVEIQVMQHKGIQEGGLLALVLIPQSQQGFNIPICPSDELTDFQ